MWIPAPKDVNLDRDFVGTDWRKCEIETVARNIVIACKKNNPNMWLPFSWKFYKSVCDHNVTDSELAIINQLVEMGDLNCFEGGILLDMYKVNFAFLGKINKFINRPEGT
jgi:hypothetical protein